jgi:PAS domain-containing protein
MGLDRPELKIIENNVSGIRGACSACARTFHAFVRSTEEDALRMLTRSFSVHCRLRHGVIIKPPTRQFRFEQLFNHLELPAYVFERSTRRLLAANIQFQQLMGYTQDISHFTLDTLRGPYQLPLLYETLPKRVGGGILTRRYRTKDGRELRVRFRYQDIGLLEKDIGVPDACFVVVTAVKAA